MRASRAAARVRLRRAAADAAERRRTDAGKVPAENEPMLDRELLDILACPETKEGVTLGNAELVVRLNGLIERGVLLNRGGQKVVQRIDGALVRADGKFAYPIRDGFPIMLVDEALPLAAAGPA